MSRARGVSVANSKVCSLEPMNSLLSTEVQASVYIPLIGGLVINRWLGAIFQQFVLLTRSLPL